VGQAAAAAAAGHWRWCIRRPRHLAHAAPGAPRAAPGMAAASRVGWGGRGLPGPGADAQRLALHCMPPEGPSRSQTPTTPPLSPGSCCSCTHSTLLPLQRQQLLLGRPEPGLRVLQLGLAAACCRDWQCPEGQARRLPQRWLPVRQARPDAAGAPAARGHCRRGALHRWGHQAAAAGPFSRACWCGAGTRGRPHSVSWCTCYLQ
jgi:hypothetical protein